MTLPVSSYEELLAHVRSLTSETIQLHQEITSSLADYSDTRKDVLHCDLNDGEKQTTRNYVGVPQREEMTEEVIYDRVHFNSNRPSRPTSLFTKSKESEIDLELKEVDEQKSSPDVSSSEGDFHRNEWGPESLGLWHSGPSSLSLGHSLKNNNGPQQDLSNVPSFSSSVGCGSYSLDNFSTSSRRAYSHQQLGAKVEMVYSLLSMLGTNNRNDMSKTLLAMSSSPESCLAMRQSGCLPLLIQLIHSPDLDLEVRGRASEALQNIVYAQTDDKKRRRETRVLKLLQQIREYCDGLKVLATKRNSETPDEPEKHPVSAIEALMKFSFDAEHRQAMCNLGGLHAIAELIQLDHDVHGSMSDNQLCITLRRYAGMSLTNLIFGDGNNKALLCSFKKFMRALVSQLMSPSEDLRQVTASVLRNLSWRADAESKQALREVGAVTTLMVAAMEGKKESTLKSILSALWNLSAHCSMNKVDVCAVPGAVAFLVKMLRYKAASNTLAVVENAGGILRNISSHIAVREDYRQILRDNNCFEILLEQLKSPSLTIVSNACGTLWNLSARCSEDQRKLWEMGAISMLRSLIQSKHKMISMGSSAALKNLLSASPGGNMFTHLDSTAKSLGLQNLPTLYVRKQRALEQELDMNLSETCDNIESSASPTHSERKTLEPDERKGTMSKRSESHESVTSTQSDSTYERVNHVVVKNELFGGKNVTMHGSLTEKPTGRKAEEQKLIRRYKSSKIPTCAFKKMSLEKKNDGAKDNYELGGPENDIDERKSSELKEKRGIPVLKTRTKEKMDIQGRKSNCQYFSKDLNSQCENDFHVSKSLQCIDAKQSNGKTSNDIDIQEAMREVENYEEYPNFVANDFDQPMDFSLKYGEEMLNEDNSVQSEKTKDSMYNCILGLEDNLISAERKNTEEQDNNNNNNNNDDDDDDDDEHHIHTSRGPFNSHESPANCDVKCITSEPQDHKLEKTVSNIFTLVNNTGTRVTNVDSANIVEDISEDYPGTHDYTIKEMVHQAVKLEKALSPDIRATNAENLNQNHAYITQKDFEPAFTDDDSTVLEVREETGILFSNRTINNNYNNCEKNSFSSHPINAPAQTKNVKGDAGSSGNMTGDTSPNFKWAKQDLACSKVQSDEIGIIRAISAGEIGNSFMWRNGQTSGTEQEHSGAVTNNIKNCKADYNNHSINLIASAAVDLECPKASDSTSEESCAAQEPSPDSIHVIDSEKGRKAMLPSVHEIHEDPNVGNYDSPELTPLEKNLIEQCILSGMPHNNKRKMDVQSEGHIEEEKLSVEARSELNKTVFNMVAEMDISEKEEQTVSASISSRSEYVTAKANSQSTVKDVTDGNSGDNYGGHTWSEDYSSPIENSNTCTISCGKIQGLRVVGEFPDVAPKEELLLPNFKIGSEVRDPKLLQAEATKICREIRKYQDFDMSCSVTSDMSQISCNSIVDSGEFSFIDLSKETGDLDSSESLNLSKIQRKFNGFPARVSTIAVLEEPITLPSVGSVKSDLFQDLDLESSIISVASLTSEVAENSYKEKEQANEYKCDKTPENVLSSPMNIFDRSDDTLNAETIGSDTEVFDEENSVVSQENLPLDSDGSKETTPKRSSKKLTPKERRQTIQDRYRTYTIHGFKCDPGLDQISESRSKKSTPKERRFNERDRFLTRVLGRENGDCKTEGDMEEDLICDKLTAVDFSLEDVFKNIDVPIDLNTCGQRDTEKCRTVDSEPVAKLCNDVLQRSGSDAPVEAATPLNNLLPISPAERKEILDNAKLVAISLKTAAQDVDSEAGFMSDSDAEGSHKTLTIDTTTYNKHTPVQIDYRLSEEEYQNYEKDFEPFDKDSCFDFERKGPKISKPGDKQDPLNEETVKAIRGRKKQIYTSPAKRNLHTSFSSMPASPKIKPAATVTKKSLSSAKSLPNVPKSVPKIDSPTLCREGTFTKVESESVKQLGMKQSRMIPVLNKKQEPKTSNNTSIAQRYKSAPVLRTGRATSDNMRNTRPVSSYIARNSERSGVDGSNPLRHSSGGTTANANKGTGTNFIATAKKSSSSGPLTILKNSASNQSIKSIAAAKNGISCKTKNANTQSPKLQMKGSSDTELGSDKVLNIGKPKTPKKEVTSKIASLWKKVEDTKKREKFTKDNRVWITSDKDSRTTNEELVIEKEEIMELSSGRVVRSSTFQALEDENAPVAIELRKKSDGSGTEFRDPPNQQERNVNFDGRNIISAIVPPFNYNPPSQIPPVSHTIKQVNVFQKGSVKVTTV